MAEKKKRKVVVDGLAHIMHPLTTPSLRSPTARNALSWATSGGSVSADHAKVRRLQHRWRRNVQVMLRLSLA